jgi:hypothetical protein
MTVSEMIELLQSADPNSQVTMTIRDPKDAAFTDDVSVVFASDNVTVVGWVASDNEEACAPWSCD